MIRSLLYVPGNKIALLVKAMAGEADAVVLDLEDAVPTAEKTTARAQVLEALANGPLAKPVFVRINEGPLGREDTRALAGVDTAVAGLLVPKAERAEALAAIAAEIDAAGATFAAVRLQPIIESVAGLYALADLAASSPRVVRFSFGAGDFIADLGGVATVDRRETLATRAEIAMRSRLLGLQPPVAHVYAPVADVDGLRRASVEDRALGFGARSCIHPSQLAIVNAAFGVGDAELQQARAVLERFDVERAKGIGAFQMPDGSFVDEAVARRARAIVNAAAGKS